MRRRLVQLATAASVLLGSVAQAQPGADPVNPSCPRDLNWSTYRQMRFTLDTSAGGRVLRAEGMIDEDVPSRLQDALKTNGPIDEIWVRSPGGHARAGNQAGKIIRAAGIPTRIPGGWACFSACNFLFMGGPIRFVDLGDKDAVRAELKRGDENALGLIGDVEQDSAMLASEDNDFLIRMGISRKLLTEIMYQQKAVAAGGDDKSTRRCLTDAEAVKYNVANAQ